MEIGTICFEVRISMKKVFWWKKASLSAHRPIRPLKNLLKSFWFFYDSRLSEQLLLLVFLKNFHFWLYIIENIYFFIFLNQPNSVKNLVNLIQPDILCNALLTQEISPNMNKIIRCHTTFHLQCHFPVL